MDYSILLVSALPFIILFYFLIAKKMPAIKIMPGVFVLTGVLLIVFWKFSVFLAGAALVKGFLQAVEIILIVFSALLLLQLLVLSGRIKIIQAFLSNLSDDARVQAILIAWAFGVLIEGVAGFGTPAALAAPLLVSLGFTPVLAVVVSLIANSASPSFGAAGTPVVLGFGSLGFDRVVLDNVSVEIALFHLVGALFIPLAISYLVTRKLSKKDFKGDFLSSVKFALFSGIVFFVPYYLSARFLGPELPTIFAGIFSIIVLGISAKYNFLVPEKSLHFSKYNKGVKKNFLQVLFSISPYILIVFLLSFSRVFVDARNFLTSYSLGFRSLFGYDVGYSFLPFFTPSFYFLIGGLFCLIFFGISKKNLKKAVKTSALRLEKPFLALIFTLGFVQLLILSEFNPIGLESIPLILAEFFASFLGKVFVLFSPVVGLFGAFITGSNTVSNLLFGVFQYEVAQKLGISFVTLLALQCVGGAIGNMISVHNILSASAVVGYHGGEGEIIRHTIVIALIYALLVGIFAMFLI